MPRSAFAISTLQFAIFWHDWQQACDYPSNVWEEAAAAQEALAAGRGSLQVTAPRPIKKPLLSWIVGRKFWLLFSATATAFLQIDVGALVHRLGRVTVEIHN